MNRKKIQIIKKGITDFDTDAIVNAANSRLRAGSGVCGAIFAEAGHAVLEKACQEIGFCETGDAVITSGFDLKAKYIIHAVGPIWNGGRDNEPQLLYNSYANSLKLAKENDIHSITFPLISAGIFGFPKDRAWQTAIEACKDFLTQNNDYDMQIIFAVVEDSIKELGERTLRELIVSSNLNRFDTLI